MALQDRGFDVGVMKPLESGASRFAETLIPSDAYYLKEITGVSDDLELVNTYCFEPALAPGVAAERLGVEVDLQRIRENFFKLKDLHQLVVVEGAGGLLVPIARTILLPELIALLQLPILLVVRASLGTINHTLLTVSYCQQRGLRILGIIINRSSRDADPSEDSNAEVIARFTDVPIFGTFPYLRDYAGIKGNRDFLSQIFSEHIAVDSLIERLKGG